MVNKGNHPQKALIQVTEIFTKMYMFMVIHSIMDILSCGCITPYGLMTPNMDIQSNFWLDSRMNSEVHNDTDPDSGGVSASEAMVIQLLIMARLNL